jgi:hypothetical protein
VLSRHRENGQAPGVRSRAWRRRRTLWPVPAGVATAAALAAAAHGIPAGTLRGEGASWRPASAVVQSTSSGFKISGKLTGLYPGATRELVLVVHNPQMFPIVVTSITTTVASPSAGCQASNLVVTAFSGELPLRARTSAEVSVPVLMRHVAPDACQGAVFPLTYSGLGKQG